jgi:hypothetical protein
MFGIQAEAVYRGMHLPLGYMFGIQAEAVYRGSERVGISG